MPFKKQGSPFWQYDRSFKINGQHYRVRGSTGERSKTEARAVEESAVSAARHSALYGDTKPVITLDQAIGTYVANVSVHQPSWKTTKSLAQVLLGGLKKNTALPDITNMMLTNYIAKRRSTLANASVNREIQLLRRVLNYAEKNLNMQVPVLNWDAHTLSEPKGRVRELTIDEEGRLFENLRPDLHAFVKFCITAGCRSGSAVKLEWRDIDFQRRVIVFRMMKGGEHHSIPMTNALLALLANQPRSPHYNQVFLYPPRGNKNRLRPITKDGWKKPWKEALTAAKIPDFRFHDLRHTALSRITRTNGIAAAQKLAGHADISSTARYAHVQMDDLLIAMETAESTHTGPTLKEKSRLSG